MTQDNLLPAIIQDWRTGEVLMLAYMNAEALRRTKETGYTWFWSRSRQTYWNKGETSGNLQAVKEIRYDCDEDTYLVLVEQIGGKACHTGNRSCFYRQLVPEEIDVADRAPVFNSSDILDDIQAVVANRKKTMPAGSYTAELFREGPERLAAKLAEESEEVIEASRSESDARVISESADLLFHLMVLLAARDLDIGAVKKELKQRRK